MTSQRARRKREHWVKYVISQGGKNSKGHVSEDQTCSSRVKDSLGARGGYPGEPGAAEEEESRWQMLFHFILQGELKKNNNNLKTAFYSPGWLVLCSCDNLGSSQKSLCKLTLPWGSVSAQLRKSLRPRKPGERETQTLQITIDAILKPFCFLSMFS